MAVDPYAISPCGTNKKIKFYCPELIPDIEKIERMMIGQQRVACLEHLRRMSEKYPDHSIPMFYEGLVRLEMGELEGFQKVADRFREKHPGNQVAHGFHAISKAIQQDFAGATEALQDALEQEAEVTHTVVLQAMDMIAGETLRNNLPMAAQALFLLLGRLATDSEIQESALGMVVRLNRSAELPSLLKLPLVVEECPSDFPNQAVFQQALADIHLGRWRKAHKQFEELRKSAPRNVAILRNLATLALMLGDHPAAINYLHTYAIAAERSDFDSAVEAEALARFLDQESPQMVERTKSIIEIANLEGFLEKLRLDSRVLIRPITPEMMTQMVGYLQQTWVGEGVDETLVPPKLLAALFDRPALEAEQEITPESIPHWISEVLVFGKESDREARVEFRNDGIGSSEPAERLMLEIGGDTLNAGSLTHQRDEVHFLAVLFHEEYNLPEDLSLDKRREVMAELRQKRVLEQWAATPIMELEGKSPRDVVGDTNFRLRLAAAIVRLETEAEMHEWDLDCDSIRTELKLPGLISPYDPLSQKDASMPRLSRVDASQLSDDKLAIYFQMAASHAIRRAARKFGHEILRRDLIDGPSRLELYAEMCRIALDAEEAIEYSQLAQEEAKKADQPLGMLKVVEFSLRARMRDVEAMQTLVADISRNHAHEPGVAEAFSQLLEQMGIGQGQAPPQAAAQAQMNPPPADGGIWSPGAAPQPAAAPEGEAKQGGLWLPGMD
ncbi:MAG: hypothetical protein WDZ51_01985 [Pirellulaceae bacterium]